ncbi:MAG: hypothetical protein JSV89_11040 [Spirochaetaceae bacterium]|nr:MAG: hypothetical protein JSV89_11040 [Spirochaetaceae bacterium]
MGKSFDLDLMVKMARLGGGSSRFISDRKEMEETFGSELDRMAVPLALNLVMKLEFLVDVDILDTWGYENRRSGDTVHYYQRTFHHGDHETILAHVRIQPQRMTGTFDLARFTIQYQDVYGNELKSGPHIIQASFVDIPFPVTGFSDGMVLRSGTMLHLAQNLKTIGELYYSNKSQQNLSRVMQLASDTKKELVNARMRLDNRGFEDEIRILDNYLETLGRELQLAEARIRDFISDVEAQSLTPQRSFRNHIKNLCTEIARINTISLIREQALYSAIRQHGYTIADLTDKLNAMTVGRFLAADYIVTGTVMETTNNYIIFSRLLNIASGEVESTAQVIVAK